MVGLKAVHVQVAVVLGSTRLPIREILKMGRGTTIPLDSCADDLSELHANGLAIACGRMQVAGEQLSFAVTELLAPER